MYQAVIPAKKYKKISTTFKLVSSNFGSPYIEFSFLLEQAKRINIIYKDTTKNLIYIRFLFFLVEISPNLYMNFFSFSHEWFMSAKVYLNPTAF